MVNLKRRVGQCVLFVYPYTGRPGYLDPDGWDDIAGAHGSTPQALAYSKLYSEFSRLNVAVFGLSFQDTAWQRECVERHHLPFSLLSDSRAEFASRWFLRTFMAGGRAFLRRRTLVINDGFVVLDRTRVDPPQQDAAQVLAWLQRR